MCLSVQNGTLQETGNVVFPSLNFLELCGLFLSGKMWSKELNKKHVDEF